MSNLAMATPSKHAGHQIYKLRNGTRVPGCTTITGVMDKSQFLVPWANRLGLRGVDSKSYVDHLADAGTLAHYLVECDIGGTVADQPYLDEFSKKDHDLAANAFLKYLEWRKGHTIQAVGIELQLVSEEYRFGGTLDLLLVLDGELTLVDIKTCKAIYGDDDDKWTQVAGYKLLGIENGHAIMKVAILRLGRDEDEGGIEFLWQPRAALHEQRFLKCRELYDLNSQLKRGAA